MPALAVIDNGRSIVVDDQVTARAPIGPAIADFFNFFGKGSPIILSPCVKAHARSGKSPSRVTKSR
jgi:hypothetical protein